MSKKAKNIRLSLFALIVICTSIFFGLKLYNLNKVDPSFDSDTDIKNGKIHLITYGLSLPSHAQLKVSKQIDSLEASYGFEWENRGCITDSLSDLKAGEYNKKILST